MSVPESPAHASRRLGYDILRIVSICGVVSIHTFSAINTNPDERWTLSWWLATALSTGFVWAVPVFVMLSGALSLTPRAHAGGPIEFYKKRAKRIIPALIFWNLVYLVIIRMFVLDQSFSRGQLVATVVDAKVYPQLYFLWLILGLYLIAPILAAFLNAGGAQRALITAGISLGFTLLLFVIPGVMAAAGSPRPIYLGALNMWLPYVGYFIAGYALSRVQIARIWVILLTGLLGLLLVGLVLQKAYLEQLPVLQIVSPLGYLGFGTAVLAICVFVVGSKAFDAIRIGARMTRFITTLSEAAFGVFLVHMVVLLIVYRLVDGYSSGTSFIATAASYLVIVVVSFAISIGAQRVPGLRLVF